MPFDENLRIIIALRFSGSQSMLAAKLRWSPSVVSRLASGQQEPNDRHLSALEALTGAPQEILLSSSHVLTAWLNGDSAFVPLKLPIIPQIGSNSQATRRIHGTLGQNYDMYYYSEASGTLGRCSFFVGACNADGIEISFSYVADDRVDNYVGRIFSVGAFCYLLSWPSDGSDELVLAILNTPLNKGDSIFGKVLVVQSTADNTGKYIVPSSIVLQPISKQTTAKAAISRVEDVTKVPKLVRDHFKHELDILSAATVKQP